MTVEVGGTHIVVDLRCLDCDYEWQEDYHEDHVANAIDREFECPDCKLYFENQD